MPTRATSATSAARTADVMVMKVSRMLAAGTVALNESRAESSRCVGQREMPGGRGGLKAGPHTRTGNRPRSRKARYSRPHPEPRHGHKTLPAAIRHQGPAALVRRAYRRPAVHLGHSRL